ncbi:MAG: hypothetical protein K9N49_09390 [Candidatus Marinimicrobia bacterium]|nr:hypothetical protein [Candidatus Neomarinimicrobiota bacterium]
MQLQRGLFRHFSIPRERSGMCAHGARGVIVLYCQTRTRERYTMAGPAKQMWLRIQKGEKVVVKDRIIGKLPNGCKWEPVEGGWTLAPKTAEEMAQSAPRRGRGGDAQEQIRRTLMVKGNYSLLSADELMHVHRWIAEIMDQKKEEKKRLLQEEIAKLQKELTVLR